MRSLSFLEVIQLDVVKSRKFSENKPKNIIEFKYTDEETVVTLFDGKSKTKYGADKINLALKEYYTLISEGYEPVLTIRTVTGEIDSVITFKEGRVMPMTVLEKPLKKLLGGTG